MKKIVTAIAILIMLVLAGLGVGLVLNDETGTAGSQEVITIGEPPLEQSAFIYIAEDQGFFARNGLKVILRDDYANDVESVGAMLNGDVDISVSAEYPVITAIYDGSSIRVIGVIDRYQNVKVIGRKDRGIERVSDLRGKRIGIPRGTICEFFFGRFLALHRVGLWDVELVDVPATRAVDAIVNGDVDAIVYFQPHIYAMENRLGESVVSWPIQSNQLIYTVLACREDWAAEHPETVEKFLDSLRLAEEYANENPDTAKAIVQRRMHVNDEYLDSVWADHQFSLSLDQSLILAMNDEARWMIQNTLTTEKIPPDFRTFINTSTLEHVKPESVNIR